ncbi:MAPEG family protein [Oceanicoccus sp. KOV_DT_Chl]|uniref:MAPEG family protein n=1 Tax=Oceanicoccus sp. KOV_DT_Chl TaxID=1904639 RepID=UPI000C7A6B57|nr:MAPEG family protein [Oceanicoccus sp. KOV_DT_Chl]
MALIAAVISLILLEYYVFMMLVGMARGKSGIQAPQMTGDPKLERAIRVQMNTLEQMVVVIPCLWLFGTYISTTIGAGLGVAFIIGRALYCKGYMADPNKRAIGFVIGFLATLGLLGGAVYGTVMAAL